MNEGLFITLWIIACALAAFSSITFFIVKKPEYTMNKLMEYMNFGYWYKNLNKVVPEKLVAPIYYSAFLSALIAMLSVIWLVASNV